MGRERALRPPTAADGPNSISLVTAAVVEAGEGFCRMVSHSERVDRAIKVRFPSITLGSDHPHGPSANFPTFPFFALAIINI